MDTFILVAFIVVAVISFVIGLALLLDWWKPFKSEQGEKKPLSKKEKWVVGALLITGLLGLVGFFFSLDHPILKKWREKRANGSNGKVQPASAR